MKRMQASNPGFFSSLIVSAQRPFGALLHRLPDEKRNLFVVNIAKRFKL